MIAELMEFIADLGGSEFSRNFFYLLLTFLCVLFGFFSGKKVSSNDSQQGEFFSNRTYTYLIIGVVILGGCLRFYGLAFGLPAIYHPDEFEIAGFLTKMMRTSSIDPHYGQQPSLIIYLSWPVSLLLKYIGLTFNSSLVRNVFAGRIISALAGTVSIYLVYAIGREIYSKFSGLLAAFVLAVIPLHVTNSRYMKQDVLFTSLILACVFYSLRYVELKKVKYVLIAGLFGGLAMGSKYTGITSIGILVSTAWLFSPVMKFRPDWQYLKQSLLSVPAVVLGFFLCVPYALFGIKNFISLLHGMQSEARHAATGHHGLAIDAWSQLWMFHLSRSLIPGMEALPLICALLGIGYALYKWESKSLWIVGIFLMFWLPAEAANSKPPPQPDRYVVICTPFLALLCAEYILSIFGKYNLKLFWIGIFAVIFFPLIRTVEFASEVNHDTRKQMQEWMVENLPSNSKIILSGAYIPKIPQRFKGASGRRFIGKDKSHIIEDITKSNFDYLLTSSLSSGRFHVESILKKDDVRAAQVTLAKRKIEETYPVAVEIKPRWGSYGFHNPTLTLYKLK